MTLSHIRPRFLYPSAQRYPFDDVCRRIVEEFRDRNWNVPGLTVTFYNYGTGEQKLRRVDTIEGEDFILRFGRPQGLLPGREWNDTAAVSEIGIPRQLLRVYEKEDGPTYYRYVGWSWKKDREYFFKGLKVNSKLYKERRTYLKYSGSWGGPYIYRGQRAPLLVHDNDLGREYGLRLGERRQYETQQVMEKIRDWLEEHVLSVINSVPVYYQPLDEDLEEYLDIPFPSDIGPLFTYCSYSDQYRIETGQLDRNQLSAAERYAMQGSGWRLVPYDVSGKDLPTIAREGFLWCGLGDVSLDSPAEDLHINSILSTSDNILIRVMPSRANDIYITDFGPAEQYRKQCFETTDRLTEEQYAEYKRLPGMSIIPITEYSGGYEMPVVLIHRELDFDEVEIIGKLPRRF